jgi:valyl-tRNA synthetase
VEVEVLVGLKGIVDAAKEQERVEREIRKTEKNIAALEKKLANKGFVDRAPAEVVQETKASLKAMQDRRQVLSEALELARELA